MFYIFHIRDRIITPVNVWANCVACQVVEHYSHGELHSLGEKDNTVMEQSNPLGRSW